MKYLVLLISTILFSFPSLARTGKLVSDIDELSWTIQDEVYSSTATRDQLRLARKHMRKALRLVRGRNVEPIGGEEVELLKADCHIDDDKAFDFDQHIVDDVYGKNPAELEAQCSIKATYAYGSYSSSGIKNIARFSYRAGSVLEADCHIDDDKVFDFDQKVIGKVYGDSPAQLSQLCNDKATSTYGSYSSSGIKNINTPEILN